MMAKEIDHRVMNSLQLVSSRAAGCRAGRRSTAEASSELGFAADRVSAIARIHQHIYLSEGVEQVDCKPYLERLCADLSTMLPPGRAKHPGGRCRGRISTAQIVALGLIVNELVTNAIKYGSARITVSLAETANGHALSVVDQGPGLPADFDPAKAGLGMKVVSALVQQLRGCLVLESRAEGARLTVQFPAQDVDQP